MYTSVDRTRRVRDTNILWLLADLTIVKFYGIYIRDGSTLNINVETFRKYFKLCGNIKIKSNCVAISKLNLEKQTCVTHVPCFVSN